MLHIDDVLTKESILQGICLESKKALLDTISLAFCQTQPDLNQTDILEAFIKRERLGSTALGHGVAIPHVRISNVSHARGLFVQLTHGIEFEALDKSPVDLIFALMVPAHATSEHLHLLAGISSILSLEANRQALRQATNAEPIFKLLTKSHHAETIA